MAKTDIIEKRSDGTLHVPDFPVIPFIEGDGIGPDIWRAAQLVLDEAVQAASKGRRKIEWLELDTHVVVPRPDSSESSAAHGYGLETLSVGDVVTIRVIQTDSPDWPEPPPRDDIIVTS